MPDKRYLRIALGVIIISAVALTAYAITQVTIYNNVTINTGVNLIAVIVGPASKPPICSSSTGNYADTGLSTSWTLNQGSSQIQYICVENVGTGSDTLRLNTSPSPPLNQLSILVSFAVCSYGSCTSGNVLAPGAFALATVTLSASPGSASGTTPNAFSITIT